MLALLPQVWVRVFQDEKPKLVASKIRTGRFPTTEATVRQIYVYVRRAEEERRLLSFMGQAPLLRTSICGHVGTEFGCWTRGQSEMAMALGGGSSSKGGKGRGGDEVESGSKYRSYAVDEGARRPGSSLLPPKPPPRPTTSVRVREESTDGIDAHPPPQVAGEYANPAYFILDVLGGWQGGRLECALLKVARELGSSLDILESDHGGEGNTAYGGDGNTASFLVECNGRFSTKGVVSSLVKGGLDDRSPLGRSLKMFGVEVPAAQMTQNSNV